MTTHTETKANLTEKADTAPKKIVYRVFWKTSALWDDAAIAGFHKQAPAIAERLRNERYLDGEGHNKQTRLTCEDFAIRVLIDYAHKNGLPVKLTTGVRTYANMEIAGAAEHGKYPANPFGFADMIMLTYGAPDMQRVGVNTIQLATPEELLPGDILAQALDRGGTLAHHIMMCVQNMPGQRVDIYQGNSSGAIVRPITTISRWLGRNRADPRNDAYAGTKPQRGSFSRARSGWDYQNLDTGSTKEDFLKYFLFYRWNFMGFNK